ncbi:hypothetical protein EDB83DRAFT_2321519 [Lactarius deliciosus]|nr:hypothetical protein EDB83DRAFT_2321519 [Lactarius deliciosus]
MTLCITRRHARSNGPGMDEAQRRVAREGYGSIQCKGQKITLIFSNKRIIYAVLGLEAATARFNGQPIRPDDQWCPRLVCRVRRREDDLMAGVGAQRGNAMHIKWVKDQKAKVQREQADTVGSPKDMVGPSSPLSVSSDDSREAEEHVSAHSILSRSPSIREYELTVVVAVVFVTLCCRGHSPNYSVVVVTALPTSL